MVYKDNAYIGSVVKDSKPKDYSPVGWKLLYNFSVKLIIIFQELSAKLFTSFLYSC